MRVTVRMMGIFSKSGGKKEITLDMPEGSTIGSAIMQLIDGDEALRSIIWDSTVDSPSPNALIMLDGVEINNLEGTETPLKPEQEMVLISIVHGG
jgi:molybdopterin converting factor small subunit